VDVVIAALQAAGCCDRSTAQEYIALNMFLPVMHKNMMPKIAW